MLRFQPAVSPIASLFVAVMLAACAALIVPAADAASPAAGATWKASDEGNNPFRPQVIGQWAPVRTQAKVAESATQDVLQASHQGLIAPSRVTAGPRQSTPHRHPTAAQQQPAAGPAPQVATDQPSPSPNWRLPTVRPNSKLNSSERQARTPRTGTSPDYSQSAAHHDSAPQPFIPPSDAMEIGARAPHNLRSVGPQRGGTILSLFSPQPSASAHQGLSAPPRSPQAGRAPASPHQRTAMNHRGRHPSHSHGPPDDSQLPRSYAARMWESINVAFQTPENLGGAPVEPESLPMPGSAHDGGQSIPSPENYDGYYGEGSFSPHEGGHGGCSCPGGCASCGSTCGSGMCGCEPGCGCGCGSSCGRPGCNHGCDLNCIGPGDVEACQTVRIGIPRWQELTVFGGAHGFKGPYDQDRDSGNFGFHEGFNTGWKLPYTSMGYQIGYRAVHSQLSGDKDTDIADPHTQQFITVGMFQRAKDGVQGGIAWDFLRDERWGAVDFHQLRGELSLIDHGCHEWGVAANVHLNQHEPFPANVEVPSVVFQTTDQYLLFYRYHGRRGGEGRFFGGVNDDDDGILGADMFVPLQDRWSLQAGFTYLFPDEPGGQVGAAQEAWNLGMALVWHWDCRARKCHSNCYRPLFNVADNGSMIVDDRLGSPALVDGNNNGGLGATP